MGLANYPVCKSLIYNLLGRSLKFKGSNLPSIEHIDYLLYLPSSLSLVDKSLVSKLKIDRS